MGITNNGQSAYSSLYIQTRQQSAPSTNETGQVYVGAGSMVVQTRTNHPIILKSYADEQFVTVPDSLIISNNATRDVIINTPLTVNNNVTINGFLAAKPYVSLRVVTSGGTPSTGTTVGPPTTIGTPGTMTVTNYGYTTSITASRGSSTTNNAFLYTFSWATPHPLGSNYVPMCQFQGSSTNNTSPNGFFRVNQTSTSISVWVRTSDGSITDESFYVYTVP